MISCLELLAAQLISAPLSALAAREHVSGVMSRDAETITPDSTLHEATRRMWEQDVGWLPVTNGIGAKRILGVITDRDICMAAHLRSLPLSEMRVHEAMASPAVLCRETDSLSAAHARMRDHQVRRLPVVDSAGHLSGVITLGDLARFAVSASSPALRSKRAVETAITLAAISAGRGR
jgi:CBS domain-containing protein